MQRNEKPAEFVGPPRRYDGDVLLCRVGHVWADARQVRSGFFDQAGYSLDAPLLVPAGGMRTHAAGRVVYALQTAWRA